MSAVIDTFQITPEGLSHRFRHLFISNESIELCFKLVKDIFIFTNFRLIVVDVQGITNAKIEIQSLPYRNISRISTEAKGISDPDANLKIWTTEATPVLERRFNKMVNIYEVQRFLAEKMV